MSVAPTAQILEISGSALLVAMEASEKGLSLRISEISQTARLASLFVKRWSHCCCSFCQFSRQAAEKKYGHVNYDQLPWSFEAGFSMYPSM